jgi:hypothetical protein
MGRLATIAIFLCAAAAAEGRCPWLNAATASGVLGGSVGVSVTSTSCEFSRAGAVLRIEVTAASAPAAQCGHGAEPLKGIGNQAFACEYKDKPGWIAEQVVGTVRDQAFVVRISATGRAMGNSLREKTVRIAGQVAGILF